MLRVASHTNLVSLDTSLSEYEDNIHFDSDDPDFVCTFEGGAFTITGTSLVPSKMSLASVHHPADVHSSHGSLATLSHSLEDITSWGYHAAATEAVLTIEDLRNQLNCCFTCGVSWVESHVSLDCSECGGYALERPCPECDGACGSVWKRDLSTSHASGKAKWSGECGKIQKQQERVSNSSPISHELSSRLERLNATS